MSNLNVLFYFVALLCLVGSAQAKFLDADTYDGNCTGESGNLENVGTTALDRFIRKWQGRAIFRIAIRFIKGRLKDPNSGLSKMLGSAAADPTQWDDSKEFNFEKPEEPTPMYVLNFLAKVMGSTATVYSYLWNYGFIPKVLNLSKKSSENYGGSIPPCALTNAIREFQLFNQIHPHDGKLTKETIKKMAEDRCGNLDAKCNTPKCLAEDRYSHGKATLRRRRYAVRNKKWKGSLDGSFNVAYYYENDYNAKARGKAGHDKTMTPEAVKKEIEKGLFEWSKYSDLTFIETKNPKRANVKIRFGGDDHGEKNPKAYFDGPYGVLAHMYYPRKGGMHFDEAENYTADHTGPGISMHFVAAHEMGHGLGIEHSSNPRALMAPYYIGYRPQMLAVDDIQAVRHLYGVGTGKVIPKDGDIYVAEDTAAYFPEPTGGPEEEEEGEGEGEGEGEEAGTDARGCPTGRQVTPEQAADMGHCIVGFTAGFRDPDREYIYLFYNENNYLRLESGHQNLRFPKVSEPKTSFKAMLVSEKFPGLEGPYDAAVTDEKSRVTYFFVEDTVSSWDWSTNQVDLDREPITNTIFAGIPDPHDIEAVAQHLGQYVFFSGDEYYIFTEDDGVSGPFPAELDGEMIASAFHSFYNGFIYTTSDSYLTNNVYNLMQAKRITTGVGTAEEFQDAIMNSYNGIDMDDDTMFGWPCGLGFCGTEVRDNLLVEHPGS